MANILQFMPELSGYELQYVQNLTEGYTEKQMLGFSNMYRARRKDPQLILLTTLIGFVGFAGIQRFLVGQIGMGIIYFFTAGLCLIGTIVDLINYQDLAFRYNQRVAGETKMQFEAFNK